MPGTFDDIKLGPCLLTYGAFQINETIGGVTVSITPMTKEIKVDQWGSGPVDHRVMGWDVKVTVPMAKTDFNTLKEVAGFLDHVEDGGDEKLTDTAIGSSMRAKARELFLRPVDATDDSEDVTIFMAGNISSIELGYDFDNERVYNVEFIAYPKTGADPTKAGNYYAIGDPSADPALWDLTFAVTDSVTTDPVAGAEISIHGLSTLKKTGVGGEAVYVVPDGDYYYTVVATGYNTAQGVATVDGANLTEAVALTT